LNLKKEISKNMKEESNKKGLKHVKILEINISSTSKKRVINFVRERVARHKKFYIVTPNPEIVMMAQEDEVLRKVINNADLSIPDGVGLAAANKFLLLKNPKNPLKRLAVLIMQGMGVGFSVLFDRGWITKEFEVIKGREVFNEIIELANKRSWKVFLVGDRNQSAQKAKAKLVLNYKKVNLTASDGPNVDKNAKPLTKKDLKIEKEVIKKINQVKPQFLFVGFGAPKQEKWLDRHFNNLNINGAMVLGGTFDYTSGKKKLPPSWVNEADLEWLWRLFVGQQKVKRVYKAFPDFPLKVFWYKLNK
jgi:N-acetylglucosaminyldiphosphoundecaprenol N-acetyl-beta-D-mannosaminyltransferase